MKQLFFACCILLFVISSMAQDSFLSPRIANYDMEVTLDVSEKKLYGRTKLTWTNPGSTNVTDLQFHLYYNAFKNSESSFLKESGDIPDFFFETLVQDCGWSWSAINTIVDHHGNNLADGMQYIQPDDDNENDQTVLQVLLPDPVAPGDSIEVDFNWEAKIPKAMIRTGYNMDYYFFAQWFPKVGVYETAGTRFAQVDQWNCHQYHANGEYYADFGNYKVALTVPKDYIIGASGSLIQKTANGDEATWTFTVNDVIDFTWTTSPHFTIQKDTWRGVDITLLSYPGHEHFADRYFTTVKNAFEFLDAHVGEYPYPTLTMVDPPIHGLYTGGMEYPTLITSISFCFLPINLKSVETLVTHEFIHQYFMQMVATHEQEEPWMDEGLTTYYEGRILDQFEGKHTSFVDWMGITIGSTEFNRGEFFASPDRSIADQTYKARDYKHGGYGPIAYNKTAIWLKTLEGLIGQVTFDLAIKTYFEKWKFKHPNRNDFIQVFNDVIQQEHGEEFGPDLNWFFDQVLYGTEICDYAVADIESRKIKAPIGYIENTDECVTAPANEKNTPLFENKVILRRLGGMKLPVEVLVKFENGDQKLEQWDGQSRSHEFIYTRAQKLESVEIDPKRKIWIDCNFVNNSQTIKPQTKGIRKYWLKALTAAQHMMESLTAIL
jgi:hypothetical protein